MPTDLFEPRFQLRRQRSPRSRPRGGPYGYVDGVGWLAPGLLWIDGWLSIPPARRLEISFEIAGEGLRRQATCFTASPFVEEGAMAARRWILVVEVGDDYTTASRLRALALATAWGDLLWLGASERLIAADVVEQLRHPRMPRDHLERLRSFLEIAVRGGGGDASHPVFRRNLSALRRAAEEDDLLPHAIPQGDAEIAWTESFGTLPAEPEVSVIITLLKSPDLLDHHFAQQRRSRGNLVGETILVVGPQIASAELTWRLGMLSDLYDLPTVLLELSAETTWAAAAGLGARQARGEFLAFYQEQTFCCQRAGLVTQVAPLRRDPTVGITAPLVRHFDGTVRSRGFSVVSKPGEQDRLAAIGPPVEGAPERSEIAACSSDCFAVRSSLFHRLGGFGGAFVHEDFESIDLCLRTTAAGHSVNAVEESVTRFVESAAQPPLTRGTLTERSDYETLRQRHFSARRTAAGAAGRTLEVGTVDGPAKGEASRYAAMDALSTTVVIPTLNPGPELADVLDRLEAQQGAAVDQILVIDSSSTDGTRALLERRGIEHQVIARKDFNHGLTRNLGVQKARGEVVAFLSQDALPEPGWLAGLLEAFDDASVGGAYSRQLPREDASPFAVDRLAHWPASAAEPRRQLLPPIEVFETMPLAKRLATVCFDNVSSAVRRSVALDIPFRDLPFGEDRDWAYRAMAAGYTIRYCSASAVIHSHDRSAWRDLRRTVIDHRLICEMLDLEGPAINGGGLLLPALRRELMRLLDVAAQPPSAWRRMRARATTPARALVGVLGPYLGSRIAYLGPSGSRKWRWLGRVLAR